MRILTPKTSTDRLLSIRTKLSSSLPSAQQRMPYRITFVGANGVGKSTNLSKVCFWLIQNSLECSLRPVTLSGKKASLVLLKLHLFQTLRVGAVRSNSFVYMCAIFPCLASTTQRIAKAALNCMRKGTGRMLRESPKKLSYAKDNDFDVVLIDTAGCMQDNEPLMRALAKLVAANNPDKIILVGEALVGNEAVDQLI
ncbi:P-loop containing nucleoside triphosphate hydrolase protein, partial [Suillus americanus]